MNGYTVTEAASVLGVPTERVWELLARGILAGEPDGETGMRVFLTARPAPAPVDPFPGGAQNGGPRPEPERELSPFRELLTEFRNLTERYGQALLALGESRGEVASLRSRVDLLEARMDLRLPFGTATDEAPGRAATVAEEIPLTPPGPLPAVPLGDEDDDEHERRARRRRQRRATESFAEAMGRALDPTAAELPDPEVAVARAAVRELERTSTVRRAPAPTVARAPAPVADVPTELPPLPEAPDAVLPRELPVAEPVPTVEEADASAFAAQATDAARTGESDAAPLADVAEPPAAVPSPEDGDASVVADGPSADLPSGDVPSADAADQQSPDEPRATAAPSIVVEAPGEPPDEGSPLASVAESPVDEGRAAAATVVSLVPPPVEPAATEVSHPEPHALAAQDRPADHATAVGARDGNHDTTVGARDADAVAEMQESVLGPQTGVGGTDEGTAVAAPEADEVPISAVAPEVEEEAPFSARDAEAAMERAVAAEPAVDSPVSTGDAAGAEAPASRPATAPAPEPATAAAAHETSVPRIEREPIEWDPKRYTVEITDPDWFAEEEPTVPAATAADEPVPPAPFGAEAASPSAPADAAPPAASVLDPGPPAAPGAPSTAPTDKDGTLPPGGETGAASPVPADAAPPPPPTAGTPEEPSTERPAVVRSQPAPPASGEEEVLWYGRRPDAGSPGGETGVVGRARADEGLPGSRDLEDALAALDALRQQVNERSPRRSIGWPTPAEPRGPERAAATAESAETPLAAADAPGIPPPTRPGTAPPPTPASRAYRRLRRIFPG